MAPLPMPMPPASVVCSSVKEIADRLAHQVSKYHVSWNFLVGILHFEFQTGSLQSEYHVVYYISAMVSIT